MPDLWDTNPRNAFSTPHEQPDLTPDDHDDDTMDVMLKDHRGYFRPPDQLWAGQSATLVIARHSTPRPLPGGDGGQDVEPCASTGGEDGGDHAGQSGDEPCRSPAAGPVPGCARTPRGRGCSG